MQLRRNTFFKLHNFQCRFAEISKYFYKVFSALWLNNIQLVEMRKKRKKIWPFVFSGIISKNDPVLDYLSHYNPWFVLCNTDNVFQYLTLNPLTWKIRWVPNNASRWQMRFKSAFKALSSKVETFSTTVL